MRGTIQDRWWTTDGSGTRAKTDRYREGLRYRARFRGPDGREHSKSFETKEMASQWLRGQLSKVDGGAWTDPTAGHRRYSDWSAEWLGGLDIKPKTLAGYESLLTSRVLPAFGPVPLSKISGPMVRRWVAAMVAEGLSPSRIRQARQLLRASLEVAVADGVLGRNPIEHVKVPADRPREQRFLDADQVQRLSEAAEGHEKGAGVLVSFLAVTGLRWGEAVALRRSSVDLMRRRVHVSESATEINGRLVLGVPKTHRSREVALPRFLAINLEEHCAGMAAGDLVFTSPRGGYLRSANFRTSVWKPALKTAGIDESLRIHDLRSTTASMLISSGANVKVVQRTLGHASAAVTLNTYAGLFSADLDSAADALDQRFSVTNAAPVRPEHKAKVIRIDQTGA
jgi:integrase